MITSITSSPTVAETILSLKVGITRWHRTKGDNCGCMIYELFDDRGNTARIRLEEDQDINKVLYVLDDMTELYCYGRHELSRIHLFRAYDVEGNHCEFAMTYSQVYQIGLLMGLDGIYTDLLGHCSKPVNMRKTFSPKIVLHYLGVAQTVPTDKDPTFHTTDWNGLANGWTE